MSPGTSLYTPDAASRPVGGQLALCLDATAMIQQLFERDRKLKGPVLHRGTRVLGSSRELETKVCRLKFNQGAP